jgi:Putative amidoligase enzyme
MLCAGGIEMRSPKLWASPESNWISQVKQTWSFLQSNYEITKSFFCSTHVHISIENGFESRRTSLQNLKKIAQCAIHFEAALEACVPEERQGNRNAKSNWIDNRNFAEEKLTRRRAIDMIEKCKGEEELIDLMCPDDRNFAWNFQALRKHGTVEFRKGAASLEGDQAIAWAQLVLQFVQAAVQVPRSSWERLPANIRGLRSLLGLDAYGSLDPILKGMDGENSLQPEIVMECANWAQMQMLERKLDADMLEQERLTRGQQA